MAQNKHKNAQISIDKIEKFLNLKEIIFQKKKKFDAKNLPALLDIAEIYIHFSEFVKAEIILKYCEEYVKDFLRCDLVSKSNIYRLFVKLYIYEKKLRESKMYLQKCLEMQKQYNCYNQKMLEFAAKSLNNAPISQEYDFSNTY